MKYFALLLSTNIFTEGILFDFFNVRCTCSLYCLHEKLFSFIDDTHFAVTFLTSFFGTPCPLSLLHKASSSFSWAMGRGQCKLWSPKFNRGKLWPEINRS